ncbi:MAG: MBL fold metallo-hydrolase [Chloroflexi bacterium]|nr:MBL fold metallo-hydrolase [Chloroflexota bacterium]
MYIVGRDRLTLIDAGMRGQGRNVVRGLRRLGVDPRSIATIALTHWHIDHTGGLRTVRRLTGASVACHVLDAPYISGQLPPVKPAADSEGGRFGRWLLLKMYQSNPVDYVLEDAQVVPGSEGLEVIATPGHTPGHVCYYLPEARALFVGDALVNRDGILDFAPAEFSASVQQAKGSLARLSTLDIEQCHFGHGTSILEGAGHKITSFLAAQEANTSVPDDELSAQPS